MFFTIEKQWYANKTIVVEADDMQEAVTKDQNGEYDDLWNEAQFEEQDLISTMCHGENGDYISIDE